MYFVRIVWFKMQPPSGRAAQKGDYTIIIPHYSILEGYPIRRPGGSGAPTGVVPGGAMMPGRWLNGAMKKSSRRPNAIAQVCASSSYSVPVISSVKPVPDRSFK